MMGPGLTILAAGGITAIGQISRKQWPTPRIIIGTGVAGAALLIVAQSSPELAQKFATLVLITALLTSGYDVSKGVTAALNRTPPPQQETPPT
jgi:hypothetical protein